MSTGATTAASSSAAADYGSDSSELSSASSSASSSDNGLGSGGLGSGGLGGSSGGLGGGTQLRAGSGRGLSSGSPPVDAARLRVALFRLSRRLRKHEVAGLTPTQLSALAMLELTGPMRLGDLAAAERIAPSTLTRLISALEDSGYVQRVAVPQDARAAAVAVTEPGRSALSRIRAETTSLLADSLLLLTPDQLAALAAALPALEQLADALPGQPRRLPSRTADQAGRGPTTPDGTTYQA